VEGSIFPFMLPREWRIDPLPEPTFKLAVEPLPVACINPEKEPLGLRDWTWTVSL